MGIEVIFFENNQNEKKYLPKEDDKPNAIDKALLDEMRLSQLMIDDPLGFEKEIVSIEQRRLVDDAIQN